MGPALSPQRRAFFTLTKTTRLMVSRQTIKTPLGQRGFADQRITGSGTIGGIGDAARTGSLMVYSRPEDRFPAPHGYAATREEAMQAFASVWYG